MTNIDFLSTIPLFSSLSAAELKEIAEHWKIVEKSFHEIIFNRGDPANSVFIIQEGGVNITLDTFHEETLMLSHLTRGEMFGELTLFDINKRSATASAASKTILLEMPRDTFIHFLKKFPDIALNLLGILSKRLRDTNEILEQHVTRNVNDEAEIELTLSDKVADKFAGFIGSWVFIFIFMLILFSWIALNTFSFFFKPLDHYPFILLNLILSCLAAIQAPVIMMSQGRQAKKDHIAAELDYKINLKAELQIEEIMIKLDQVLNKLKASGS